MLEFRARMALALDVSDFLHLERAFERHGVVVLTTHEKHSLGPRVFRGDVPDVVAVFQDAGDLVGNSLQFLDDAQPLAGGLVPDTPKQQCQQRKDRHLRGERFGRSYPNLGSCVHIYPGAAFAGDGARHVVADTERPVALAHALAHRRQRVDGLATLADGKDERVLVHRHVAVPKLTGEIHFARQVRERLDHVFADQSGVVGRAAGRDDDAVHVAQFLRGHVQAAQARAGVVEREAPAQAVAHTVGLLEDFLEHVVRVIAQLHVVAREIDFRHLVGAGDPAFQRGNLEAIAFEHGHVVILQVDRFLCVRDDGLRVTDEKILPLAETHRQWRAAPRADDDIGHVQVHGRDAVGADDLFERRAGGLQEPRLGVLAARLVVDLPDEMGQDFGVRLGAELVPGLQQLGPENLIVFDDPVVDQRQPPGLVEMRVRVLVRGTAVRGPASVGNADLPGGGMLFEQVGEHLDAPGALADFELAAVNGGEARRVVAAIFQPPQPVQQDGGRRCLADVADDSAHRWRRS